MGPVGRSVPSFGDLARQYRMAQGLTLGEVEIRSEGNISNQYLSMLENGKRSTPSLAFAQLIVKALELDAERAHRLLAVALYNRVGADIRDYMDYKEELPPLAWPCTWPPDATLGAAVLVVNPLRGGALTARQRVDIVEDEQPCLSFVIAD